MKLAVAQINTTVGDFPGNSRKIINRIAWARGAGADLIVFPEMALTGYPPRDLLGKPEFVSKNLAALATIARATDDKIAAVVGCVSQNPATQGKGLFNSAAFLHGGRISSMHHKTLLPTYDVFDETRHFESAPDNRVVSLKGRKIGLTICEDLWFTTEFRGRRLYDIDPVDRLAKAGADMIINIAASPYAVGKLEMRERLVKDAAKKNRVPVVYVNCVGGNDELIFDGRSLVVDREGLILKEAGVFVEDEFVVDMEGRGVAAEAERLDAAEEMCRALVLGLRDYVTKCGFEKVVVGLSGGIDSALVAALAVEALGASSVMGIAMPTRFSSRASTEGAQELAKRLEIHFKIIDIDPLFQAFLDLLVPEFHDRPFDTTEENIQARIRGNILMALSNKFGAMVLSTGNKSEMAVGYCTLYGDLAGGLAVISDVPKTLVYKLADYMNREKEVIPASIIKRPPSAELKANQTDQDELPPYDILDGILKAYVEDRLSVEDIVKQGFQKAHVEDIVRRIDRSEYKRKQAPPGLKVTSKAFGFGRRYPIACQY